MTQKMLHEYTMIRLVKVANRHLGNDWRIVLGSIGGTTTHRAAKSSMEYETQTKDGKVFTSAFWCVVEKDTEARADSDAGPEDEGR